MVSDIINGKTYVYDLVLCKTNREPICFIPCCNFSITKNYHPNYNSISFNVNKYIKDSDGQKINPAWNKLGQALLVHLYERKYHPTTNFSAQVVYEEFFYITSAEYDAESMVRSVSAESWHKVHFENIKIRGYDDSRKLYDYTLNGNGEYLPVTYNFNDILKGGILNYIQEYLLPNWTIVYDYEHLATNYSDNEKASINNVKALIDAFFGYKDGLRVNDNPTYSLLFDKWIPYTEKLADYYGASLDTDGNIQISTNAEISTTTMSAQVGGLLNIAKWINTDRTLSEDEVGTALADNTLVGKQFSPDWLTYDKSNEENGIINGSMIPNTDDEFNTNILKILYLQIFQKVYNYMKSALEKLTGNNECLIPSTYTDSNGAQKTITLTAKTYDDGYTGTLQEYYDITLYIYKELATIWQAINNLAVYNKNTVRALTFNNDDLTSVFTQLEDSYICQFQFDNVNNYIYVYSRDNEQLNQSSNLIISPYNYIEGFSYKPNLDKIVTRLYFTGKDNLTLASANPTGQRYVDDFSPFLDNNIYMSDNLRGFLTWYNEYLQTYMLSSYTTSVGTNVETKNFISIISSYINKIGSLLQSALGSFISFYNFISADSEDGYMDDSKYAYKTLSYKANTVSGFKDVYDYVKQCIEELQSFENFDYLATNELRSLTDLDTLEHNWFTIEEQNGDSIIEVGVSFESYIDEISNSNGASLDQVEKFITIANFFGVDLAEGETLTKLKKYGNFSYYVKPDDEKATRNDNVTIMPILKAYRSYVAQSLDYDTAIEDYFTHYLKIDDAAQIAAVNSELHDFIFEDDISVDYITDADVGLYYTVQYFKYINTIPYDININLVDILSNSNYQRDWDNVCNLGTYITVQNPETEEYQKVRLLSYTHSPEDNQLDLTFGNQEELKDALNTLTKNIWQYTMRVAEKAQDYINMYDNVIKEAADLLGIELPDTNYDYSVSIDNSTKNYTNVYGNNSSTPTTTPPSTTTNNSTTNNYNTNVKISSIKGNALVSLSDGLYVPDLTSPSYGGTGTSTGSNTNTGTGGSTVDTKHVILSSMPTQEQINNYADETIVLIYDVSNVYIEDTTT